MRSQSTADNLSVDELRRLLLEKRRSERQARIRRYAETHQVIPCPGEPEYEALTGPVSAEVVAPARGSGGWLNVLLLIIEITAAAGLVLVLIGTVNLLRQMNSTDAAPLVSPTLTPTHTLEASIPEKPVGLLPAELPSGHRPPEKAGLPTPASPTAPPPPEPTTAPTQTEPAAMPTASPAQAVVETAVRIRIPAIGVDAPVVAGDDWETLKLGVGQSQINPVDPGQPGNVVLSAHNDIFGETFRDLDRLQTGDEIILHTDHSEHTYRVVESLIVAPDQVQWIGPTEEAAVTLVSCYPYLIDTHRIVIRGILEN